MVPLGMRTFLLLPYRASVGHYFLLAATFHEGVNTYITSTFKSFRTKYNMKYPHSNITVTLGHGFEPLTYGHCSQQNTILHCLQIYHIYLQRTFFLKTRCLKLRCVFNEGPILQEPCCPACLSQTGSQWHLLSQLKDYPGRIKGPGTSAPSGPQLIQQVLLAEP